MKMIIAIVNDEDSEMVTHSSPTPNFALRPSRQQEVFSGGVKRPCYVCLRTTS